MDYITEEQQSTRRDERDEQDAREARTEVGNAQRLVAKHGADLRYCTSWDSWLVWNGRHWSRDDCGAVTERTKDIVRDLWQNVAAVELAGGSGGEWVKFAKTSSQATAIRNAIGLARSVPGIPISHDMFDANRWLLNVADCTVDLRTGERLPHRREDLITKFCPVVYDPDAPCPTWERFLATVLGESKGLIKFIQRACGYSLTGDVSEQMLLMLYGKGANGKSTFLNALIDLLGPGYAMQAADGLLMAKNSESHPTDRADLYGKRFVSSVEVDDNRRLAESRVKQLTGGDAIRARRMREDFWQFKPTHKLWLAANHMPVIKGTDLGIWRRVKLVPFTVTIPISERDPDLPAKLAAERAGILAWAVRGCLDWQREGLAEPEEVTAATDEYRDEMDTLGEFLAGHCIEGSAYTTRAADMLKAYSSWCYDAGEKQIGQRRLGKALSERGFERYTNNGTWYRGIGLRYGTNGTNGTNGTIPLFHPIRAHA